VLNLTEIFCFKEVRISALVHPLWAFSPSSVSGGGYAKAEDRRRAGLHREDLRHPPSVARRGQPNPKPRSPRCGAKYPIRVFWALQGLLREIKSRVGQLNEILTQGEIDEVFANVEVRSSITHMDLPGVPTRSLLPPLIAYVGDCPVSRQFAERFRCPTSQLLSTNPVWGHLCEQSALFRSPFIAFFWSLIGVRFLPPPPQFKGDFVQMYQRYARDFDSIHLVIKYLKGVKPEFRGCIDVRISPTASPTISLRSVGTTEGLGRLSTEIRE